jgi:type II secretory ATPase GspE/PulE/Tfp pilus assembly ATPase PilB-like protein
MNTGYQGRMGLFEFLVPDETMREILETNVSVSVIRELARKSGYRPLREEGLLQVMQGATTVEEVIRVTT